MNWRSRERGPRHFGDFGHLFFLSSLSVFGSQQLSKLEEQSDHLSLTRNQTKSRKSVRKFRTFALEIPEILFLGNVFQFYVEMLSSLLSSSSSRVELFKIELGSGRAFKFEPRVGSGRTIKCELGSGFASFMYCTVEYGNFENHRPLFF